MPEAPSRPPTHEALDVDAVWDLGDRIDALAPDLRVTPALLARAAAEAGVPPSHAYVACSVDPRLEWERTTELTLVSCVGGCQGWGAVEVLERLLAERDARRAEGRPSFDVATRGCLNMCQRAPAVFSFGARGQAGHAEVRAADVPALVASLVGP